MAETIGQHGSSEKESSGTGVIENDKKIITPPQEPKDDAKPNPDNVAQIALSEDGKFFLMQFPESIGMLKASGWVHEIALVYLRNHYNKKAVEQMKQKGLLKSSAAAPGFRGFNPLKWGKQ